MTLDEAIKHCEEKAKELRKQYELYDHWDEEEEERANGCLACAEEHEQLAEWLRDYKRLLTERQKGKWIDYSNSGYVECPICEHMTNCEGNIDELHYCWNCGAKMGKDGEE